MSIRDVIKKSFLQGVQNGELSLKTILVLLVVAALLGIFIFYVYKIMTVNSFYSKSFNLSLILMCVITTAIIVTIQNSVVVSLGMVGALSIVRFRTAVKEPLDLIFMFWSISIGVICGAAMPGLAVLLSVICAVLILCFYHIPESRRSMILVVNAVSNECMSEVYEVVSKYDSKYHVKSRNLTKDNVDFLMEVRVKNYEELLSKLQEIEHVVAVSVVSNQGESVF